jgi:hypothetical protein
MHANHPAHRATRNLIKYFTGQVLVSTKCTGASFSTKSGCMIVNPYMIGQKLRDKSMPPGALKKREAANAAKKPGEPQDCGPKGEFDDRERLVTRILHELAHSSGTGHDREFYDTHRFFAKVASEELGWKVEVNCRLCCDATVPCETVCPKCEWMETPRTCKPTEGKCRPSGE